MAKPVNIYEAKTHLSSLVERAAKREEIIIAKAGKPLARLVALSKPARPLPRPWPKGSFWISPDFDAPLTEDELREFEEEDAEFDKP